MNPTHPFQHSVANPIFKALTTAFQKRRLRKRPSHTLSDIKVAVPLYCVEVVPFDPQSFADRPKHPNVFRLGLIHRGSHTSAVI